MEKGHTCANEVAVDRTRSPWLTGDVTTVVFITLCREHTRRLSSSHIFTLEAFMSRFWPEHTLRVRQARAQAGLCIAYQIRVLTVETILHCIVRMPLFMHCKIVIVNTHSGGR